jgi:hypothetical protein
MRSALARGLSIAHRFEGRGAPPLLCLFSTIFGCGALSKAPNQAVEAETGRLASRFFFVTHIISARDARCMSTRESPLCLACGSKEKAHESDSQDNGP